VINQSIINQSSLFQTET